MPYTITAPDVMASAAMDLAAVGSNVTAAHMAAAIPTLPVLPTGADEVSTGIAQVFTQFGQGYQAVAARAAAFGEQFVQHLTAGAGAYASAEGANAAVLQPLTASAGFSFIDSFIDTVEDLPTSIPNEITGTLSSLEAQGAASLGDFLFQFIVLALAQDGLAHWALTNDFGGAE